MIESDYDQRVEWDLKLAQYYQELGDLVARVNQMDVRAKVTALRIELEEAYVTAQNANALANSLAARVAALEMQAKGEDG
jgi:hypothetical protein